MKVLAVLAVLGLFIAAASAQYYYGSPYGLYGGYGGGYPSYGGYYGGPNGGGYGGGNQQQQQQQAGGLYGR